MKNGILYILVNSIIQFFYRINAVEIFKYFVKKFTTNEEKVVSNIQITIDLFIIFKFILVLLFWKFNFSNIFCEVLIWYLILTNLFTYFYYHIWTPPFKSTNDSKRRRFMNLLISFVFSTLCFAFLYSEIYFEYFSISSGNFKELSSLLYSSFTSLFASYDSMKPTGDIGYVITLIQMSITFFFISIILSGSIPQLEIKNSGNAIQK